MEKILIAVDAVGVETNAVEFACYLGRLTRSKITGLFLENMLSTSDRVLQETADYDGRKQPLGNRIENYENRKELIERNISLFKEKCISEETLCQVHRNRGIPEKEVVMESRFADLLVIDPETSFTPSYRGAPTAFTRYVLKNAECPVVISPKSCTEMEEVVFAYDRSASSVFAMKQFTYLFPQLHNKKVTILQVSETGQWLDEDKYIFSEWLKDHYTDLHFEALKGDTDTTLLDYLLRRKHVFLVMGAYGRNNLSQVLKHSRARLLIATVNLPIFIAHR
ncbi:MAG: universal stress protein [Chitinophagaceae bacterium]|nr:universal stress protein [Chitinophagaceae bacterium]